MDDIDRKIIKQLQQNGRISVKSLAEIVSLSPPAVAERLRKLEESKVILGYTAVVNQSEQKKNVRVIINATIAPEKQAKFIEFAKTASSIICVNHVTGAFSMSILAVFSEISELGDLVTEIQRFGKTQTLVVMSTPIVPEPEDCFTWFGCDGI
jgi:Transcriptional regulators